MRQFVAMPGPMEPVDIIGYIIGFDLNSRFVADINNSFDDRALSDMNVEVLSDSYA